MCSYEQRANSHSHYAILCVIDNQQWTNQMSHRDVHAPPGDRTPQEDDDYTIMEEIIRREALEDPDYERFDNEEAAAETITY